jgi:hypothetical protein
MIETLDGENEQKAAGQSKPRKSKRKEMNSKLRDARICRYRVPM